MTKASTLSHIFELSIALERSAEEFYQGLAERFAHLPEVAQFWRMYAAEEASHARKLETLRSQLEAEKLRQVLVGADGMIDAAYRLLSQSPEMMLRGIRNLDEACQMAIVMENSETNAIFEFLVTDLDTSEQARDFLREQIHVHVGKIQLQFPAEYQDIAKRKASEALPPCTGE